MLNQCFWGLKWFQQRMAWFDLADSTYKELVGPFSTATVSRSWKIIFFDMKRVYPKSQNVGYINNYIYTYTYYPNVGYWWIWWKSNAATLFSHRPTSVDLGAAMGPKVGAGTRLRIPSANRRSLQNWKLAPWPHLTSLDPVWTIDLNQNKCHLFI